MSRHPNPKEKTHTGSLMKSPEIAEVIGKQAAHTQAKISAKNLDFFYGEKQALFENNLEIATNRVTAIIGPSVAANQPIFECIIVFLKCTGTSAPAARFSWTGRIF